MTKIKSNQNTPIFPQYSLEELINDYPLDLEAANRSPKTISAYTYTLNRLISFLKSQKLMKPVDKLGTKEIMAFIRHLQNSKKWPNSLQYRKGYGRLSPFTVQRYVRDVKAFWSWLACQGYIESNPLVKLPLPKVPQYIIRTLTNDQVRRLLSSVDRSTAPGAKYYCVLLLLMDTGMRISELVNIRMSDLDAKIGLITVLGKGQKERVVPFSRWTRKELIRYISNYRAQLCPENSPYLFPTDNGEHISVNSIQQFMRRLVKKAGLNGMRCFPHIFRHTFATQAIANEANVFALKAIMGHASLQTTMKYIHLQTGDLKHQHDRFSPVENLMKTKS